MAIPSTTAPGNVAEMLRRRAGLVNDARTISDLAATENRVMTEDERTRFDTAASEAERLGQDIAARQRVTALEGAIATGGNGDGASLLPHHRAGKHSYSILRAINLLANHQRVDGLEAEVSQELELRRGRKVRGNGIVMPLDLPIDVRAASLGRQRFGTAAQRALDTGSGAGGIPTILDTTYIDLLRNRMMTYQAGARVLTDMIGNFAIPRQSAAATAYWVPESGPVTPSNQIIDQVLFSPHTVGALTDISRRLAEQLNRDAEMFVRDDLLAVTARALDLAALNGQGANNQPLGIMQNPAIPVIPIGVDGGPATWALVVGLETQVAKSNADIGALAYMTNAPARGSMKTTAKIGTTFPIFLWETGDTPLNGYPAFVTNQIPSNLVKGTATNCSGLIYGNWNDLVYALWSGQDVIVDPYTGSSAGTVRVVTLQDADVHVRHPESFAVCVDMTTP
jgi:HK97 family phage major capsid protein